jgi:hypothetical protein
VNASRVRQSPDGAVADDELIVWAHSIVHDIDVIIAYDSPKSGLTDSWTFHRVAQAKEKDPAVLADPPPSTS